MIVSNSARASKWVHCLVDKDIHDRLNELKDELDGVSDYEDLFDKMAKVTRIANSMEKPDNMDKVRLILSVLKEGD